jgi:hypothetical protein
LICNRVIAGSGDFVRNIKKLAPRRRALAHRSVLKIEELTLRLLLHGSGIVNFTETIAGELHPLAQSNDWVSLLKRSRAQPIQDVAGKTCCAIMSSFFSQSSSPAIFRVLGVTVGAFACPLDTGNGRVRPSVLCQIASVRGQSLPKACENATFMFNFIPGRHESIVAAGWTSASR